MAQVLAVVSGKGGTGKTSVCAAVSSCLAMEGQRVLCIDLDMGLRNLDISLGMRDEAVLPFTSILRGEYTLAQAAKHPTLENLWLLTAPVSEGAESVDKTQFCAMIEQAGERFDWIVLDAPAGVGRMFRLAAAAADEAIVVTLGDPASQRDAARAADLVLESRQIPVRLVVNRISRRLFAGMRATVDDVIDSVGLQLIGIVPEDPAVTLAAMENKPLVQYSYEAASLAAMHIARRLMGQRVALMKI